MFLSGNGICPILFLCLLALWFRRPCRALLLSPQLMMILSLQFQLARLMLHHLCLTVGTAFLVSLFVLPIWCIVVVKASYVALFVCVFCVSGTCIAHVPRLSRDVAKLPVRVVRCLLLVVLLLR